MCLATLQRVNSCDLRQGLLPPLFSMESVLSWPPSLDRHFENKMRQYVDLRLILDLYMVPQIFAILTIFRGHELDSLNDLGTAQFRQKPAFLISKHERAPEAKLKGL